SRSLNISGAFWAWAGKTRASAREAPRKVKAFLMVLPPSTKVEACAAEKWAWLEDCVWRRKRNLAERDQEVIPVAFPARIALSTALLPFQQTIRLTACVSWAQLRRALHNRVLFDLVRAAIPLFANLAHSRGRSQG